MARCAIPEVPKEAERLRPFIWIDGLRAGEENRLAEASFLRQRRGLGDGWKVWRVRKSRPASLADQNRGGHQRTTILQGTTHCA